MITTVEVLFTPAEIALLPKQDLARTSCVVFDILRATSVFVTALAHGAEAVQPVTEIAEALTVRRHYPEVLLAGERQGLRLRASDTGGVDFDFGNSPREFTPEAVRGQRIVSTTTNGTRALRACTGARQIFAGSFLNLGATAKHLGQPAPERVLLVCAGTGEALALEDVLAAGAFCAALQMIEPTTRLTDSAQVATRSFRTAETSLPEALANSTNGRRLLAIPELREDVAYCAQRDVADVVVGLSSEGWLKRVGDKSPGPALSA